MIRLLLFLILPGQSEDYRYLINEFNLHDIEAQHYSSIKDADLENIKEMPGMIIISEHSIDEDVEKVLSWMSETCSVTKIMLISSKYIRKLPERVILKQIKDDEEFELDILEVKKSCLKEPEEFIEKKDPDPKNEEDKKFDPSRLFKSYKKLDIKGYQVPKENVTVDEIQIGGINNKENEPSKNDTPAAEDGTETLIQDGRPKVIICTGHSDIDEGINLIDNINVVGITNYKSEVYKFLEKAHDVVILSNDLDDYPDSDDEIDILDIIHSIKSESEVIFINFSPEDAINILPSKATLTAVENMGVKIINNFTLGAIERLIFQEDEKEEEQCKDPPDIDDDTTQPNIPFVVPKINIQAAKDIAGRLISKAKPTFDKLSTVKFPEAKKDVKNKEEKVVTKHVTKMPDKAITRNIIGVVGCQGVGKTFVATNIAWRMAECGYKVVLVDGSTNQDIFSWLQLPNENRGLIDALNTPNEPEQFCFSSSKLKRDLFVLSSDPLTHTISFDMKAFQKMISNLAEAADYIIIDLEGIDESFIRVCNKILLVADTDDAHTLRLQKSLEYLEKKGINIGRFILGINKYTEAFSWSIGKVRSAAKLQESFLIPYKGTEIIESIHFGTPASEYDSDLMLAFFNVVKVLTK